jgi:hypothetical protein
MRSYNRFIERMRHDKNQFINKRSYIELSQTTEELQASCHIENRGNKLILSDNTGNIVRIIPI